MTAQLLKSLFMETRPALLRFMQQRGASADEAEDLIQELYLKLESFRAGPIAEPRAYLYRMANNLLLDRRRSSARRVRLEEQWSDSGSTTKSLEADEAVAADNAIIAQQAYRDQP